jgi:hypothetical protein
LATSFVIFSSGSEVLLFSDSVRFLSSCLLPSSAALSSLVSASSTSGSSEPSSGVSVSFFLAKVKY